MLNEIKTMNEQATIEEVNEYLAGLFKKYDIPYHKYESSLFCESDYKDEAPAYVRVMQEDWKMSADYKLSFGVKATCGTRLMKEMTVSEMIETAQFIKACAKITETFNDRMNGVTVNLQ